MMTLPLSLPLPAGRRSPGDHCKDCVQDGRVRRGTSPDGRAQGPARDGGAGVQAAQREDQRRHRGGGREEGRAWNPAEASRVAGDVEHITKLTVVPSCPATGGAEQDGSGGDEVQASQEALRGQAQRPPQQHQDPGGKPGRQGAGASGGACSDVFFKQTLGD